MDETKLHMDAKMEYLGQCLSTNSKKLKKIVMEKFWVFGKELGRKKKYYIEFNPTCDLAFRGGQKFLLLN